MAVPPDILDAQVIAPCTDVSATLAFLVERLGFAVVSITPADAPAIAVVEGHGVRLRLEQAEGAAPPSLRVACRDRTTEELVLGPGGLRVVLAPDATPLVVPTLVPAFSHVRAADPAAWSPGRAGMLYRDLIPDRQGGRFIASQIRIVEGGDVADWVHHHAIRMQLIYCHRGWVRVVYEDQGEPLVMRPGDCVLQPPTIRHRVLAAEAGTEVIEIACPAAHMTCADATMTLPTDRVLPTRDYGGQRFAFHRADAFDARVRDLGLTAATDGLVRARVTRGTDAAGRAHAAELSFTFVLEGAAVLSRVGHADLRVDAGDAVVVPAGVEHRFAAIDGPLARLEVEVG